METRKLFFGVVGSAALLAVASNAMSMPIFYGEANKLSGVPVAGDETYTNAGGNVYKTPADPLGLTVGPVVGKIESVRAGGLGVGGINLPQPANVAGVASDIRNAIPNPTPGPYAGTPTWGARSMGVFQWQAIQDGISTSLTPLGSITGVVYGLTPRNIIANSAPAVDGGISPGSVAGDGVPDFIPWVQDPFKAPGNLVVAYTVQFWDVASALNSGLTLAQATAISAKKYDYQDTAATPTLLDISAPGSAYGGPANAPVSPADNDADTRRLLQTGLDPNTGLPTGPPTEVVDATDSANNLLLAGYLRDVSATLIFRLAPGAVVPTLELDIQANEVDYFDGSLLGSLVLGGPPAGQAALFPKGYSLGTMGASLINIDWANIAGTDPAAGANGMAFDFAGYGSASVNQSFNVSGAVPEPVTAGMAGLGIGALGLFLSRRRRVA